MFALVDWVALVIVVAALVVGAVITWILEQDDREDYW